MVDLHTISGYVIGGIMGLLALVMGDFEFKRGALLFLEFFVFFIAGMIYSGAYTI